MDYYIYKNNKIPILDEKYDVIIVGGGTAGSIAAIASAREGAKTLIIEKYGFLGGSSTAAQVTPMMHIKINGNPASSIDKEIRRRLINYGYGAKDSSGNDGWFNPEMMKFVLEEMLLEYNGSILYDTFFLDSIVEDYTIKGVLVHNKSGISAIFGKVIIDCTGDADVAFSAGVPCFIGDERTGKNQAISLRFMVGNIDLIKLQSFLKDLGQNWGLDYPLIETAMVWNSNFPLESVFKKGLDGKVINYEDGVYFQAFSIPGMPGVMSFNCPEIPSIKDALNAKEISYSYQKGREMIQRLYKFLKKYIPGFEESYILSVAPMIGIRESRRIKGKYILNIDDYNKRSKFDDAIAKTAYPVDVHGMKTELKILPIQNNEYFEIPFRCLVPLNIKGLLVAGRCISSTFIAQSSIRIQPTCRATGEAAGIAAAYSIQKGIKVSKIEGREIRKIMRDYGYDI
ncbi:FAD-dependent oxidoreductase [Thermoanaerobacterium sp. CMT5567-10]|uniref:FAD-dependent oxidoreductase n=1 Tax=Thermoanaerobacterium sp. CMT5567-10 TaxID=3061989 RepID=UPI0026E0733F|nr:FAD-dependent oxidoreductase [Thermoanaerobacterium sp. CMT5567-10]WKV09566.1 FAD-dependent oxidoreductase [Thermoanaerobacterium sp. CMT5567-10]